MTNERSSARPVASLPPLLTSSDGRPLPLAYRWLRAHGLSALSPWYFLDEPRKVEHLRLEFAREVAAPNGSPVRDIVPFAREGGSDDIAGFVADASGAATERVCLVHLSWSAHSEPDGWPRMTVFADFWAWLRECAIEDSRGCANEAALALLLREP